MTQMNSNDPAMALAVALFQRLRADGVLSAPAANDILHEVTKTMQTQPPLLIELTEYLNSVAEEAVYVG